MRGPLKQRLRQYTRETVTYFREAERLSDFLRVMRVRLSQSKVGPLVCREPIVVDVSLRSLGRGIRIRSHTTDVSVLGDLLVAGSYRAAAEAARGARTIVDLGANTGLVARWLLERFPEATIVSVEPERENLSVLRHNLAAHAERAQIVDACVGGYERRVSLVGAPGREFAYSMIDVEGGGDVEVVTMSRVLTVLGSDHIDFLKCDIEGAERELFETSTPWIANVGTLAVECHGEFTAKRLIETLSRKGLAASVVMFEATPQFGCEQIVLSLRNAADAQISAH
jgi:FkbM family methyltransferase